jgi:hypothetical protein
MRTRAPRKSELLLPCSPVKLACLSSPSVFCTRSEVRGASGWANANLEHWELRSITLVITPAGGAIAPSIHPVFSSSEHRCLFNIRRRRCHNSETLWQQIARVLNLKRGAEGLTCRASSANTRRHCSHCLPCLTHNPRHGTQRCSLQNLQVPIVMTPRPSTRSSPTPTNQIHGEWTHLCAWC